MKSLIKKLIYISKDLIFFLSFEKNYASFRGCYKNFDEATRSIKNKIIGYDNNESANDYLKKFESKKISEFEYPLFFWLNRIFDETNQKELTIFDFGGNLGGHYFKFKENSINDNFKWLVCEVEVLTKFGKEKFANTQLNFTSDINEVKKSDIFFSSGAIQYVESLPLPLSSQEKPKHILLARLPMQDSAKQFVTLQNGGVVFYPQYVFNKADFISDLESVGYELVDEWKSLHDSCVIPFHRDKSCSYYTGFYFRLSEAR